MTTPIVTDDFQQKSDNFMSWLKQRPGASISSKIRVADKRRYGAGRGIGTSFQAFPYFFLPGSSILTCTRSSARHRRG
jgi:hypothetical protein